MQDEARNLGHGYIGTEHFVIVVAGLPGRGADTLRAQAVGPDALREAVRTTFDENQWNRYVPDEEALSTIGIDLAAVRANAEAEFGSEAVAMRRGNPGLTRRMVRVLEAASARAQRRGDKAGIDDVFAALLDDGESMGVKVLQRSRVDVAALRQALGPK